MNDGVGLADVAQELVAEALTLGSTLHQSGDVYNLAGGGHDASGVYYLGELCESFVRHGDHAHVRLDGAEGEIGCLSLCARQTVEQRRLAHVGKSYNTTF